MKPLVVIVVSTVLALAVLALVFFGFGIEVPAWPTLIHLAIMVTQGSYDLVLKGTADLLAEKKSELTDSEIEADLQA